MWYKKATEQEQLNVQLPPYLLDILQTIKSMGGYGLVVGGAVRDALLGIKSKDIDIEVYHLSYQQLQKVLASIPDSKSDLVGQSFGVIKFVGPDGQDFDFSLPRTDSNTGVGHKDFSVEVSSNLTPKEAAYRRDFTINAISYNPLTQEVVDPYNGQEDLKNGVLRIVSPAFAEDPLRVLRGMQFAARMGMTLAPESAQMMKDMISHYADNRPSMMEKYINGGREEMIVDYKLKREQKIHDAMQENPDMTYEQASKRIPDQSTKRFPENPELFYPKNIHNSLALERINEEWNKLMMKGKDFHKAFDFLEESGWNEFYPEIKNLKGVPQDPTWHPEGDVDVHTGYVMSVASQVADAKKLSPEEKQVLMYAALCHDFAKAHTTKLRPDKKTGKMKWTAYGHEEQSAPMAENFLKSIGVNQSIIDQVVPLVANHMQHINYNDTDAFVRKLADRIHPANIEQLMDLVTSDAGGRPAPGQSVTTDMPPHARRLLEHAEKENVHKGKMGTYLKGEDILPIFGGQPGKHVGEALKSLYSEQLKGKVNNREEAMQHIKNTPFARQYKNQSLLISGNDVADILGYKGPEIGNVLNLVWDQQMAGTVTTREQAIDWVRQYLGK